MTDPNFKKISDMTPIVTPATGDLIPIVDIDAQSDAAKNKTITYAQVRKDITTAEMLDAQVTGGKIAGTTITAANLASDAVETLKIKGANVTYAKIQNVAGLSVLGNAAQAEASVQALAAGTDGHVMRRSGTGIGFGTIKPAGIDGLTTDPNDDRIVFWDDSETALGYLTAGSGLTIAGTTINAGISAGEINDGAVTNVKLGSDVGRADDWVPEVTYSGGLTNPTSSSITWAYYARINNMVMFSIKASINVGAGNHWVVAFSLPVTTTYNINQMVTAEADLVTGNITLCRAYVNQTKVYVLLGGAMATYGDIQVSGSYLAID